ncbi:MAG: IS4 family transposase [Candidatus Gracilibacteria bacterium]|nr:IS4 family transposase [Candidatus Gracilibacteria bacterium]
MKPIKQTLYFSKKTINITRKLINSNEIKMIFRKCEKYFTRNRKLTFGIVVNLILQKGVKSLQLRLNEFSIKLSGNLETITASAYVKAKNKLSYKLFLQLNLIAIINRFYDLKENEAGYKTWNNYRILAIDGSQIRLPDEKEIKENYGTSKIKNGKGDIGEYTHGLLSVLYDPLNNLALDTILERGKYSERALAIKNIMNLEETIKINEKDFMIYDRGYYSSFLFAIILSYNKEVLFRLKANAIKEADELFNKDCKINSKIITIKVENNEKEYKDKYGIKLDKKLAETIKIRLIRIVLKTGEIEVLATSLLDEEKYNIEDFNELYFKRWGIEVYYNTIKNRLGLENFSGKNVESVLQDLHSTIFLSNLETIISRTNNMELEIKTKEKELKNKQKVNKNVSFNIIKNRILDLFLNNEKSTDEIMEEIIIILNTNTTQEREGRTSSRKNTTSSKSLHFQKRKKKSCF